MFTNIFSCILWNFFHVKHKLIFNTLYIETMKTVGAIFTAIKIILVNTVYVENVFCGQIYQSTSNNRNLNDSGLILIEL